MTDPTLIAAREAVAGRYLPLTDSLGREHRSIVADAIRAGKWDGGSLVRDALASLRREA